ALEVYHAPRSVGEKVLMIGGGLVGCEVGLHLARAGKKVTVVELGSEVAPDSYPMHRIALLNELSKAVTVQTNLRCVRITEGGAYVRQGDGPETFLAADTVIYALGMGANEADRDRLKAVLPPENVQVIGDCDHAGKVFDACRGAYIAAMSIL
ncbi:MAG: FAD-dependent oxidoreductase, partial [Oscillospiraceae bacterium]